MDTNILIFLIILLSVLLIVLCALDMFKFHTFKSKLKPGVRLMSIIYDMWDKTESVFIFTIDEIRENVVHGHFSDGSKMTITIDEMIYENWKII